MTIPSGFMASYRVEKPIYTFPYAVLGMGVMQLVIRDEVEKQLRMFVAGRKVGALSDTVNNALVEYIEKHKEEAGQ